MPPKDKKKKKARKAPAYLTGEADLAPFGVQPNQLVRSALGLPAAVLGVRPDASGRPELWVKYSGTGLEAPLEPSALSAVAGSCEGQGGAAGFTAAGPAAHLQRSIAELSRERAELAAKWQVHEREAGLLKAAADKKKKKPKAAAVAEQAVGAAAAAEGGGATAAAAPAEGGAERLAPAQAQ